MKLSFSIKATSILFVMSMLIVSLSSNAFAADDPSIKGELRNDIQASMDAYVKRNTINGIYAHYDPVTGKLLSLKLDYLHSGIVKNGDIYVSCADMIDQETGKKVDMDFFVRNNFGSLVTVQAIIHEVNGKKRKYHLEKIKIKN